MPRWSALLLLLAAAVLAPAGLGASSTPAGMPLSGSCMGLMVTITPAGPALAVGGAVELSASVLCSTMGSMENVTASSTVSWALGGSIGSLSPSGAQSRFFASSNGSASVSATASYGGLTAQGQTTLYVGTAAPGGGGGATCMMTMATMVPSSAELGVSQAQSFQASLFCGTMGGMRDVTASSAFRWSGPSGLGALNSSTGDLVSFRSATPGNGTLWLTATYGTYSATTSSFVSVVAGAALTPRYWVRGSVATGTGQVVPGATVQALDLRGAGVVAGGMCDPNGTYALTLLAGATYEFRATSSTGATGTSSPETLNGNLSLNLVLGENPPSTVHPSPTPPWASDLIIVLAASVLGLVVAVMFVGGEAAQWALLLPPLLLYARLKRDQILDHFVRGRIFGYIEGHPGVIYSDILRALHLANGVASYHLYTLERERFIVSRREGTVRRFYAPQASPRGAIDALSGVQNDIVALVRERPGIWQSEISRRLGLRRQNVNYNVNRLTRVGVMSLEGWGWKKRCYARDRAPSPPAIL